METRSLNVRFQSDEVLGNFGASITFQCSNSAEPLEPEVGFDINAARFKGERSIPHVQYVNDKYLNDRNLTSLFVGTDQNRIVSNHSEFS